jgi:hypothetical protein
VKIPRKKGSKNKKTLLKEKVSNKSISKVEVDIPEVVIPDVKHRLAMRSFTLEKKVHDDFMKLLSEYKDPKLYESYIVNEIMVKFLNDKIKLSHPDVGRLRDYMSAYGSVGFEPGTLSKELDELKSANRLIHKKSNSFIQFQYPIVVDPDVKTSMLGRGNSSTSYIMNECLKLYVIGEIKIDIRDFKLKEWEPEYRYAIRKYEKKSEDED